MFCLILPILSIKFYRVLKDRLKLHFLPDTASPINKILPCAEGQVSAACSAGYCQYYHTNVAFAEGQVSAACSASYCQSYQ
jgi:hypothetical protein